MYNEASTLLIVSQVLSHMAYDLRVIRQVINNSTLVFVDIE